MPAVRDGDVEAGRQWHPVCRCRPFRSPGIPVNDAGVHRCAALNVENATLRPEKRRKCIRTRCFPAPSAFGARRCERIPASKAGRVCRPSDWHDFTCRVRARVARSLSVEKRFGPHCLPTSHLFHAPPSCPLERPPLAPPLHHAVLRRFSGRACSSTGGGRRARRSRSGPPARKWAGWVRSASRGAEHRYLERRSLTVGLELPAGPGYHPGPDHERVEESVAERLPRRHGFEHDQRDEPEPRHSHDLPRQQDE